MDRREGTVLMDKLFTPRFAPATLSSEGNQLVHPPKLYPYQTNIWSSTFILSIMDNIMIIIILKNLYYNGLSGWQRSVKDAAEARCCKETDSSYNI